MFEARQCTLFFLLFTHGKLVVYGKLHAQLVTASASRLELSYLHKDLEFTKAQTKSIWYQVVAKRTA
jgi:hypothetical protein